MLIKPTKPPTVEDSEDGFELCIISKEKEYTFSLTRNQAFALGNKLIAIARDAEKADQGKRVELRRNDRSG